MPGPSRDMGDGWETRRRRGPGHDWVVLRLGRRGGIERVDLDTTHFKGNFPESASLEGCDVVGRGAPPDDAPWRELVARTTLRANARHRLAVRSEEHTSELQSQSNLVCRLLLEKKKKVSTLTPSRHLPL